jgi:protein TonB
LITGEIKMKKINNIWIYKNKVFTSVSSLIKKLFKKNNKNYSSGISYGAEELKRNYMSHFAKGFQIAVIFHVVVLGTYLLVNVVNGKDKDVFTESNNERVINVVLNDLTPPPPIEEKVELIPPKLPEKVSVPKKDLKALEPVPVKKQNAEEKTVKTQNELEEIKTTVSSKGDTSSYSYSGPVKLEEEKIEEKVEEKIVKKEAEKTVFQSFEVEKAPEPVNLGQVRGSMKYPEIAVSANIQGRVTAKVLVGKDGNVEKIASLSGPDVFHDEVRDKISDLQFTPGLQNGKPVKVWVTVPFNFTLKN